MQEYPQGFRARRGLNWGVIGLMYTSYYMCRYDFSIANEFGFDKGQMGQIINGSLSDRISSILIMLTIIGKASLKPSATAA